MGAVHGVEASASVAHATVVKATTTAPRTDDTAAGRGDDDGVSRADAEPPLPWYAAEVPVDELGVRVFPPAPPPGVHPRVLCTAAEVPAFLCAIRDTPFGAAVSTPILQAALKEFRGYAARLLAAIPPCDREHPPASAVQSWWTADERRASTLTLAAVAALMNDDEEALELLVEVLVLYCQLTLAAAALAAAAPVGGDLEKPLSLWRTTKWDLGWGWALGGMATPLLYDWLHHRLSAGQARVVRSAIAAGTRGRRSWGMGLPGTRIQSNWATYHGHLALFCSAIEGEGTPEDEDMLDVDVDSLFTQLTANYVRYAIHESGHPIEDAYAVNLGFREGSLAMLALARRGTNLFRHPQYLALWQRVLPHLLEPLPGGRTGLLGGSSGNAWQYLTSVVVAKWVMPREPLVDWAYSRLAGATRVVSDSGTTVAYPRLNAKWQVRTEVALLGSSVWADAAPMSDGNAAAALDQTAVAVMPPLPRGVTLPLTWYDPRRGKLITRSSWSGSPTLLVLDARTEAYLVGHDTPDRGAIIFSASGRRWVVHNEWRHFHAHEDFSGIAVDGIGQVAKAPSGRWVSTGSSPTLTYAAVDLTYAHNWTWTQWAGASSPGVGWEPDVSAPSDFLPTGMRAARWLPPSLFGHPDVAFEGLYQWRRRIGGGWKPVDGITSNGRGSAGGGGVVSVGARNRMARVTRTAALVRPRRDATLASRAYGLLVDAVVVGPAAAIPAGGGGHVVTWRLSLAPDVVLLDAPGGGDILLGEESGDRRMLVRFLPWPVGALGAAGGRSSGFPATAGLDVRLDSYASELGGGGPHLAKRLVVSRTLAARAASAVAVPASVRGRGDKPTTVDGGVAVAAGDDRDTDRAATDAHFVVLLYPHTTGEELPVTAWVAEEGPPVGGLIPGGEADVDDGVAVGVLRVAESGGEVRHLRFGRGGGGETVVSDVLM